jgi:hypothetical protein
MGGITNKIQGYLEDTNMPMMAVFRKQIVGFYMFGGIDETGQVTNDLHLVEFDK